jgi:hypothetical protein
MQTMLRDEADAIVEWIEYHALLGVEHFYVYDNNSRDGLRQRLQRYRRVCGGFRSLPQAAKRFRYGTCLTGRCSLATR